MAVALKDWRVNPGSERWYRAAPKESAQGTLLEAQRQDDEQCVARTAASAAHVLEPAVPLLERRHSIERLVAVRGVADRATVEGIVASEREGFR